MGLRGNKRRYLSPDAFESYFRLVQFGDNRTKIIALQRLDGILKNTILLPADRTRLERLLVNLLNTTCDEAVRRCAYRICARSYNQELIATCQHLLPKEENIDNRMSIIPVIAGGVTEEQFAFTMSKLDCGLTDLQRKLAMCYDSKVRAQYLNQELVRSALDANDVASLRFFPIIFNAQKTKSSRKDELLGVSLFSELTTHDDPWVQKYALGTFYQMDNFRVRDMGIDYRSFLTLDLQPKKWALTNIFQDRSFVRHHLDFIEEVLSLRHLFTQCDHRVREGIAQGLLQYGYSELLAQLVAEWVSYETEESVGIILRSYMSKYQNKNKVFKYLLKREQDSGYEYDSSVRLFFPYDARSKVRKGVVCMRAKSQGDMVDVATSETSAAQHLPTVFISYNWNDDCWADRIEAELKDIAIVRRDTKNVQDGDSISKFMKSIRKQDFAVLIISDTYLKSENCMFEVLQLFKDDDCEDFLNRVIFVVLSSAKVLYSPGGIADYITHWTDEAEKLEAKLKALPIETTGELSISLRTIKYISAEIGGFLTVIKDKKNPPETEAVRYVKERILNSRIMALA